MPGLLGDSWDDPRTSGVLALAGGMIRGDLGGGLLGYNSAYQGSKEAAMKQQYMKAQMDNLASEVETRKAALAKQQQLLNLFGPQGGAAPAPAMPGQLGSGSFGVVPPAGGAPAIPQAPMQGGSRVAGMSIDQLAQAKMLGLDLTDLYKLGTEGVERKPGSFYDIPGRGREFIPDVKSGMNYQNGQISAIPGYNNFLTQQTLATEGPKAILNSAGRINLRDNADGTKSPISELDENPTLQRLFAGGFGQPAPAAPAGRSGMPNMGGGRLSPELEAVIREDAARNGIANPVAKFVGGSANATYGLAPAGAPQDGGRPQYGQTDAQRIAQDVDKEAALARQKDIAEQRKGIMNAGFVAPSNIARYQQIGNLLRDVDGGKLTPVGTEFASALNSMGIKVDKNLSNKEAAAAFANQAALELRNPAGGAGMPGAMSDADRNFLASMTPNMAQSAQGRTQVINAYVAVQNRNMQVADFARKYEKKYGKLDNGFFDQLQQWSNANPIFKAQ